VAQTARTIGELAALTADLPEVAAHVAGIGPQVKDVVRLDNEGGMWRGVAGGSFRSGWRYAR
jgi:hypothetical protein